jgi:hypothetical protein
MDNYTKPASKYQKPYKIVFPIKSTKWQHSIDMLINPTC